MKNIIQASLIVTYRCNARCVMCETWKYPTKPAEELPLRYYEKLPPGLRINITGGEPMLRADVEDIFGLLYKKSHLLELSTNGYYTEKIVRLAEKFPNILIRVSIEGLAPLNDAVRGIPGGFDHAMRTMQELKKTRCKNIGFSVVISPKNVSDLLKIYELSSALNVELGNSAIHNSWYFHKHNNIIQAAEAGKAMEAFVARLLKSKRAGIQNKLKDYGRAYFSRSIAKRLRGDPAGYRPLCGAGADFFFIDPFGNVAPCNGSAEEWIMGNIKDDSLEDILQSARAQEVMARVAACQNECCFVVTERHDMVRRPWKPICWVLQNKARAAFHLPIQL